MTYYAGDDSTLTIPVIDTNGGPLTMTPSVVAHTSAGDEVAITAAWGSAATAHPTVQGATIRDIAVPLATLPVGLWGLVLVITGAEDLFLDNVVIQ